MTVFESSLKLLMCLLNFVVVVARSSFLCCRRRRSRRPNNLRALVRAQNLAKNQSESYNKLDNQECILHILKQSFFVAPTKKCPLSLRGPCSQKLSETLLAQMSFTHIPMLGPKKFCKHLLSRERKLQFASNCTSKVS